MGSKQKEELPLMDDFTEDSLFDQLKDEEEGAEGAGDEDDNDDDDDDGAKGKEGDESEEDDDDDDDDDKSGSEGDGTDDEDDDDSETKSKSKSKSKSKDEKDKDKDDDNDEDDSENFWNDVEKLTGRTVEVDYGDTDPESPEGAAVREEALIQSAINDHLDYLSKVYPREFRALEHASNGGKMEDLYNPAEPDYSKMNIGKDDEDAQRNFMKGYYMKKGLNATKAARMVETDEDSDEGLFTATKDALKELSAGQEKGRQKIIAEQDRSNKQSKKEDMQMIGSVEQVIQKGKLNKFTVPVKEREQFHQFALQHIQRNPNGGYMFVQAVEPRELEQQLQEMYFTYKKGDLSKIVQREVKTEGAKRLKRKVNKPDNKAGAGTDSRGKRRGALPTMDEYNE